MFARTIVAASVSLFLAGAIVMPAQLATPTPDRVSPTPASVSPTPASVSPTPDSVRVTVSMNADGTRTTYEFDPPRRRAVATTTTKEGKLVGRIRYVLDDAGRFYSGEVYGPDDQFRFKTLYKYDEAGKLVQETQLASDESVRNKIVYAYDKIGRQTGYSVYDSTGTLVRQTPGVAPRSSGAPRSTPPNKRK